MWVRMRRQRRHQHLSTSAEGYVAKALVTCHSPCSHGGGMETPARGGSQTCWLPTPFGAARAVAVPAKIRQTVNVHSISATKQQFGKNFEILAQRRQAVDAWRANHQIPSRDSTSEVAAALADAERAIEVRAQAYAAVRRSMAMTSRYSNNHSKFRGAASAGPCRITMSAH